MSQINQLLNIYAKEDVNKGSLTSFEYSETLFHKETDALCNYLQLTDNENFSLYNCS